MTSGTRSVRCGGPGRPAQDAVRRWKRQDLPAARVDAKKPGAAINFVDEAGLRSDYHADTTSAPAGQTPIAKDTAARTAST